MHGENVWISCEHTETEKMDILEENVNSAKSCRLIFTY